MNILNKIKSSFSKEDKRNEIESAAQEITMSERENRIYDSEQLSLQKLYEKWLSKDKWLLHKEGIPLLLGINPDKNESMNGESLDKREELWIHAQDCIEKKLLSVLNREQVANEWEVAPADLYRWAMVSRISIPAEFSMLMAFVIQTVKPDTHNQVSNDIDNDVDPVYQKQKEMVLGAAISLIINAPNQCTDESSSVSIEKIINLIVENQAVWFDQEKLLLSELEMLTLINDYIELTKPIA